MTKYRRKDVRQLLLSILSACRIGNKEKRPIKTSNKDTSSPCFNGRGISISVTGFHERNDQWFFVDVPKKKTLEKDVLSPDASVHQAAPEYLQ